MNKKFISILSIMIFGVTSAVFAADFNGEWLGEKPEWVPEISVDNAFLTKYIWRGQNLGDDPVMQSSVSLSTMGFTANIWSNYDTGVNDNITELDYTLDYTFGIGDLREMLGYSDESILDPLSISTGYTYYTFPNVDWDTEGFDSHEIYLGASYDMFLSPSFTWYWDVGEGRGSYFVGGISHTFEFDGVISADLGMTAAYNYKQWTTESGWSDMVFSGGVNIPVFNYFTITPNVAYSLILDRDTYGGAQENEFYGGLSINFTY